MSTRTRALVRALACACLLLPAMEGAASAQSSNPAERPTLRVGPVDVRPRLVLTNVGVDNNVFNEPENPKKDYTFTAQPDVEIAIMPGRFRLSAFTGVQFVHFDKYESERSTNRTFAGRIEADLAFATPFASLSAAETSARPNAEIDARARRRLPSWTAGSRFKIGHRSSVAFSFRRSEEDFDDGVFFRGSELARTLDSATNVYDGTFSVELTPITSVSLVVSKEESRFARSPERDSDSIRVAPTLTFSPGGLMTGTAAFGYRHFNGLDASLPDYKGFVMAGTIDLKVYDRFEVDSSFSRDVRYSYEEQLPYYVTTGARATVTTLLGAGIEVRATGGIESLDYRAYAGGVARDTDTLFIYGGGAGYRIAERLRFIVEVEFTDRTSERDPTREYTNHRIFATLNWGASTR